MLALGEPFRFGLTYDIGARALFQGAYYGASIYQKEFRPGEDFVFVKPENGPASKQFFEAVRKYFAITSVKDLGKVMPLVIVFLVTYFECHKERAWPF